MSLAIRYTARAQAELAQIARFTGRSWGRAQRRKYIAAIEGRIRWLAEDPSRGRPRPDIKEGYHDYPEGSHLIFYRTRAGRIEIIGILHQAMDAAGRLALR